MENHSAGTIALLQEDRGVIATSDVLSSTQVATNALKPAIIDAQLGTRSAHGFTAFFKTIPLQIQ